MPNSIFIFVPAFGQTITATTFLCTHALQQTLNSKCIGGGVSTLSFPDIAELRAMALTIWYDAMPNCSHLLFVDADMGFPPEMVLDMILLDEPIVGTIYPQRKLPLSWAGSGNGAAATERRGNFMLVEGVGMGCTLIRRDLVTTMLEKMPEIVDTRLSLHPAGDTIRQAGANRIIRAFEKLDLPERGLVSEDLSFCIRWNQCGGKVWAAIGYRISHVGPYDYAGRYLDLVERPQDFGLAPQMIEPQQAVASAAEVEPIRVVAPPEVGYPVVVPPIPAVAELPGKAARRKPQIIPSRKRASGNGRAAHR